MSDELDTTAFAHFELRAIPIKCSHCSQPSVAYLPTTWGVGLSEAGYLVASILCTLCAEKKLADQELAAKGNQPCH